MLSWRGRTPTSCQFAANSAPPVEAAPLPRVNGQFVAAYYGGLCGYNDSVAFAETLEKFQCP
jgi:hypothetical protein